MHLSPLTCPLRVALIDALILTELREQRHHSIHLNYSFQTALINPFNFFGSNRCKFYLYSNLNLVYEKQGIQLRNTSIKLHGQVS